LESSLTRRAGAGRQWEPPCLYFRTRSPTNLESSDETEISTGQLVAGALSGDDEAARLLIDRLYPLVLRLVRSHRSRRTADEDLCQMIFVRIFHRLKQFNGQVPIEHWVSRIAINTCLNQIESERIRPELRYADLSEEQAAVIEKLASTPDELPSDQAEIASELVSELLAHLSPQDRLVITLLHLEERTIEEIKRLTGWNTALVKVRAFRARKKLARIYATLQKQPR